MTKTPADRRKTAHLAQLLEKAKNHVMTPSEIDAQRKSWVCGEMLLQYPTMTYEDASSRYDAAIANTPSPSTHVTGPQDISTAPKMTDVLVWWPIVKLDDNGEPTDEVVDGQWLISEDQGYWIEPEVMNAIGDHLGDDFTYADKPSHWMPLPAPLFVALENT